MKLKVKEKKEDIVALEERLLEIENEQNSGAKYYSLEELDNILKKIIDN